MPVVLYFSSILSVTDCSIFLLYFINPSTVPSPLVCSPLPPGSVISVLSSVLVTTVAHVVKSAALMVAAMCAKLQWVQLFLQCAGEEARCTKWARGSQLKMAATHGKLCIASLQNSNTVKMHITYCLDQKELEGWHLQCSIVTARALPTH